MMTANIPWFAPAFENDEAEALAEVISSGYVNDGPKCREFEAVMAERLGVPHAAVVTSGTTAITLSLLAAGFRPGDEAIVPDFTFIATANAVTLAGGVVRFADIEPDRLLLDPTLLEQRLTPRTRAIVPVDVNGRGCDYGALEGFCRAHDLILVCDTAEGLGSSQNGQPLGTFGDAGCFSFSPNKFMTMGQGGLVVTRSQQIADRLREMKDQGRRVQGTGGDDNHPLIGYNFKLTDLQAAVGLRQLRSLDARLDRARQRDRWYRAALHGVNDLRLPARRDENEVCLWTDLLSDRAEEISAALKAADIGHRRFWNPVHSQGAYAGTEGAEGAFPVTESVSREGLWLPSTFDITEETVARTCDVIRVALR